MFIGKYRISVSWPYNLNVYTDRAKANLLSRWMYAPTERPKFSEYPTLKVMAGPAKRLNKSLYFCLKLKQDVPKVAADSAA